jgi:hypothetical protein
MTSILETRDAILIEVLAVPMSSWDPEKRRRCCHYRMGQSSSHIQHCKSRTSGEVQPKMRRTPADKNLSSQCNQLLQTRIWWWYILSPPETITKYLGHLNGFSSYCCSYNILQILTGLGLSAFFCLTHDHDRFYSLPLFFFIQRSRDS